MDGEQIVEPSMRKKYAGCEDIYDELVGNESTSWLLGLVAFAVVEEQKIEWIKHWTKNNGGPPIAPGGVNLHRPMMSLVTLVVAACFVTIYGWLIEKKSLASGIRYGAIFGLAQSTGSGLEI